MIAGALAGYAFTYKSGLPFMGVLMGALCGGMLACIHSLLVIYRGANQLATGLTIMFMGVGITAFLGIDYVSVSCKGLSPVAIPLLSQIPVLGPVVFNQDILTYISYILCPLLTWFLFKSRSGLILAKHKEKWNLQVAIIEKVPGGQKSALLLLYTKINQEQEQ